MKETYYVLIEIDTQKPITLGLLIIFLHSTRAELDKKSHIKDIKDDDSEDGKLFNSCL